MMHRIRVRVIGAPESWTTGFLEVDPLPKRPCNVIIMTRSRYKIGAQLKFVSYNQRLAESERHIRCYQLGYYRISLVHSLRRGSLSISIIYIRLNTRCDRSTITSNHSNSRHRPRSDRVSRNIMTATPKEKVMNMVKELSIMY